ncbi:MAG: PQQ-binding-like beta-propeller repeat protein, partial [Planctomycetota bacterium]|nr:PQQ-binding-like beta-propeller repeat protein [Planctomycetota bacterium]
MVIERARTSWLTMMIVLVLLVTSGPVKGLASEHAQASQILRDTGVKGGLIVHLGCGDGKLTAALRASDSYMVHGLDGDAENVGRARKQVRKLGSYGNVSIDHFKGGHLPYIDNLVNLLISENLADVSMDEVMRVLAPEGVAYIKTGGRWIKTVKPRPREMDEWTHFLYDATGNAVANDSLVGPPRHVQWIGSPKWSRHHDHMPSLNALVSAGGLVFYVIDEGAKASILLPPKWALVARDAFNGVVLWKRSLKDWHPHLWPMKSGPTQPARRLIALEDRVYVTLGRQAPLSVLDAATGEIVRTCDGTHATEDVIASDGTLLVLVNDAPVKLGEYLPKHPDPRDERDRVALEWPWDEKERWIAAIKADTGDVLWRKKQKVVPLTLAADGKRVVLYDGERIVGLDKANGEQLWRSVPIEKASPIPASFAPTLVLYEDVVLLSTGLQQLTAVSARSGETLWTDGYSPMGHHCSEDVLVVNDLVWTGATAGGRDSGIYTGRDLLTGEVKSEFPPDVTTYWFHQRCYRSKATGRYILPSRTGIEFVDVTSKHWTTHHWVRGGCAYGMMPCNGLIYAPPHSCACYMEAMLHGFSALAPKRKSMVNIKVVDRLQKGPAFGQIVNRKSKIENPADWSTYRHDPARSSCTKNVVPVALKHTWQKDMGGRLSAVVIAENKLFVASVDTHTVYALDANSGKMLWSFTAGGRVDSPPTIYRGRVLFGSADGHIYCVRAADGVLIWRFRAAPDDLRLLAFEQIESVWPVHGSVLVQDGVVHCVAGRSMFVDGGMRLLRLDAKTGRKLSETVLDDRDPESGQNLQARVRGLNMPVALPDILSSDGQNLYMRSQAF